MTRATDSRSETVLLEFYAGPTVTVSQNYPVRLPILRREGMETRTKVGTNWPADNTQLSRNITSLQEAFAFSLRDVLGGDQMSLAWGRLVSQTQSPCLPVPGSECAVSAWPSVVEPRNRSFDPTSKTKSAETRRHAIALIQRLAMLCAGRCGEVHVHFRRLRAWGARTHVAFLSIGSAQGPYDMG